jgi:hypothetical protein
MGTTDFVTTRKRDYERKGSKIVQNCVTLFMDEPVEYLEWYKNVREVEEEAGNGQRDAEDPPAQDDVHGQVVLASLS